MASSKPFVVDGLTAQQILDLGDKELNKLSARELSRALRTVSLVANKRMKRLLQYAKKRHGKYVEKVNYIGLDLSALNSTGGKKFGVGNKNRNEMLQELARARRFMKAKTSTITGAKEARKRRERALFGLTREEMTNGMPKNEAKEKIKQINEIMPDIYEAYDEYEQEYAMQGNYEKEEGNAVMQDIGRDMLEGLSPEAAKQNASAAATERYEQQQTKEVDYWSDLEGEPTWWEDELFGGN